MAQEPNNKVLLSVVVTTDDETFAGELERAVGGDTELIVVSTRRGGGCHRAGARRAATRMAARPPGRRAPSAPDLRRARHPPARPCGGPAQGEVALPLPR